MKNLKTLLFVIVSVCFSQTVAAMFEDQESIDQLKRINQRFKGLKAKKVADIIEEENAIEIYEDLSRKDQQNFICYFTAGEEFMEIAAIIDNVKHNKKEILDAVKEAGF